MLMGRSSSKDMRFDVIIHVEHECKHALRGHTNPIRPGVLLMNEAEKRVIKHIVKIENMEVKVAKKRVSNTKLLEAGILSPDDVDMDNRARQAVSSAKINLR